ncbi:MAG: HAMP domain-containing protein, partial [Deltaproteobacteria bacterium]|nr:HAMP domain-containing protein [Deltaproteobacteria bacterium]
MFNNLIARAIVPITIAVTGFVVFGCILLYTFIKSDMTEEALLHVDNLAVTVSKSTRYAMLQDDRESLRNIVNNVGTLNDVAQIRIYDQDGRIRFSGNPAETAPEVTVADIDPWAQRLMQPGYPELTRTHHEVGGDSGLIAVSIPLLNETKCSTATCHFHPADEPVLGFLTLGISSESLEKTLDLLRWRMIIFSLMVLFLTIGGVAALLRMNLFLPILRLTYSAEQAVKGVSARE